MSKAKLINEIAERIHNAAGKHNSRANSPIAIAQYVFGDDDYRDFSGLKISPMLCQSSVDDNKITLFYYLYKNNTKIASHKIEIGLGIKPLKDKIEFTVTQSYCDLLNKRDPSKPEISIQNKNTYVAQNKEDLKEVIDKIGKLTVPSGKKEGYNPNVFNVEANLNIVIPKFAHYILSDNPKINDDLYKILPSVNEGTTIIKQRFSSDKKEISDLEMEINLKNGVIKRDEIKLFVGGTRIKNDSDMLVTNCSTYYHCLDIIHGLENEGFTVLNKYEPIFRPDIFNTTSVFHTLKVQIFDDIYELQLFRDNENGIFMSDKHSAIYDKCEDFIKSVKSNHDEASKFLSWL